MHRRRHIALVVILPLVLSSMLIVLGASPTDKQAQQGVPKVPAPRAPSGPRPQQRQLTGGKKPTGKKARRLTEPTVDVTSIFLQARTYQTGSAFAYATATGDVNKDGIADVVVAQEGPNGSGLIGLFLGKGDGTLQPVQTFGSGGLSPTGVVIADLDGDGNPDIVVTSNCAPAVSGVCTGDGVVGILFGNGDGTFKPAQVLDTGALYASSVAVADVNGDGKPDLLVTNQCGTADDCSGLVAVFLNKGDGTFATPTNNGTGAFIAVSVAAADINGDGKIDLLVANRWASQGVFTGTLSVLLGHGDGTFGNAITYSSGGIYANTVAVADVNGDHAPDLVVLNECASLDGCYSTDGSVGVLLGNGDGTFGSAQVFDPGGISPLSLAIADVNGDGSPDILVANRQQAGIGGTNEDGSVGVMLGNGDGTFHIAFTYDSAGNSPHSIVVADANRDGKPDVIVANELVSSSNFSSASVAVMLGKGDGSFQAAPVYNPGGFDETTSAVIADVNGDGKPDLFVASECLSLVNCVGSVDVLLGKGDGTFQLPQTYSAGATLIQALTVADVNGDGKPDVVAANQCLTNIDCTVTADDGSVGVLLGNGDGTFQPVQIYDSGGRNATSVAVADVNGDGNRDLLVANQCISAADCSSGTVGVLLRNGDGTFQVAQTFATGGYSASFIAAADVNGDGVPDLLVVNNCLDATCENDGQVAILFGNGDGTFQAAQIYDSGSVAAHTLALADVNGDGKLDLIVGNSDSVGVLLGNGDGTFQSALITPALAIYGSTGQLVVADFDGDGKLDVASSDGYLLLGNGDGTFTPTTGVIPPGPGFAVGDLNGDGKPDVAVGGVTILLNISGHGLVATTTTLGSSLNPSAQGQSVTFTATVTAQSPGAPNGSITFFDGANALGVVPLINSFATLSVSSLSPGAHTIAAVYSGDTKFRASTSFPLSQVVNASPAVINVSETVHVTDSPGLLLSAMINVKESVHVTDSPLLFLSALISVNEVVHVNDTPGLLSSALINVNETVHVTDSPVIATQKVTPTITWPTPGSITYGTPLSSGQLDATANTPGNFTYTPPVGTILNAGSNTLSVLFTPTDTQDYTTANATIGLTVTPATSTLSVVSSANPQAVNQPVTLTATVKSPVAGTLTGSVAFFSGATALGVSPVNQNTATLTTSFSTPGTYSITAQYSGDNNHLGSTSSPLPETITSNTQTALGITSSLDPSFVHQPVTFVATFVGAVPPDGESVSFKRGAKVLGSGVITKGVAAITTSTLPVGSGKIVANYAGDGIFRAASAWIAQTVNLYPTTTTLSSSPNPSAFGEMVVLTANVAGVGPATPTGTVIFQNGGANLGMVALDPDGNASFSTNKLALGTSTLTVTYKGDAINAKSASPPTGQIVSQASSTTTVVSSRNPSRLGQVVTFTASVATSTGTKAGGNVTFSAGGTALGTASLSGGKAKISTSALPEGATTITATYEGDTNIMGSSDQVTQQVN